MENAEGDVEEAAVDKARLKMFHRVLLIGRQKCENLIKGITVIDETDNHEG
ncbi:MAG: hypothetical protein IJE43_20450 [Alphaproteobacteria bacterium]|nr:hypothetical protein [Alphaproteobacteria bacterium]MBQ6887407.1 hypothetical protein [Lachnospiraceae bacterium]